MKSVRPDHKSCGELPTPSLCLTIMGQWADRASSQLHRSSRDLQEAWDCPLPGSKQCFVSVPTLLCARLGRRAMS